MTWGLAEAGWSTRNELEYLLGIATGKWRGWCGQEIDIKNKDLLMNYLRGAMRRKRDDTFGHVDADVVIDRAKKELERMGVLV